MVDKKYCETSHADEVIKDVLNIALKEIMSLIGAECGSLFLSDSLQRELVLNTFYNSGSIHLEGLRKKMGEGISGKVADIKEPILVKDIERDLRFSKNGFKHYKTNSFISLPLTTSRGTLGLINLADKSSGDAFSEKDFECATTLARYACFSVDILLNCTNLRAEKEVLNKQKIFLEKYASVGKLAAGVVHEINNPLDGVIRYTNILLNQIDNNSIAQEYLLEAKKGLNRIANITKSLLEFSRQVSSSASKTSKYIDLGKLIDESLDFLEANINDGIHVHKRYRDSLPKIADLGISHIIVNMIKNAFDAMPHGGILEISAGVNESHLELNFKDTGIGIPAEIKERIFDPFFTTKSIDKGTGLGLAICNEVINKYEGKIEVNSLPGEGSTFKVLIPKKFFENAKL